MAGANVRRTGTGHPEPVQRISTLRQSRDDQVANCLRPVSHLPRSLALHLRAGHVGDSLVDAGRGGRLIPACPITPADLDALTKRVQNRLVRWHQRVGLLDAEAAADMLSWEHSGFSVDASVRISLDDRHVPSFY